MPTTEEQGREAPEETGATVTEATDQGSGEISQAELADMQAQLAFVKDESAKRRIALREAQEENERLIKAALEEQGKFKELYEQEAAKRASLEADAAKASQLEERIQATNEKRIDRIPEHFRSLIPADSFSAGQLSDWLDQNEEKLTATPTPRTDAGAGVGARAKSRSKATPEQIEAARAMGMELSKYMDWDDRIKAEREVGSQDEE